MIHIHHSCFSRNTIRIHKPYEPYKLYKPYKPYSPIAFFLSSGIGVNLPL